jgi:FAD/FMN-containing dehydrogenase
MWAGASNIADGVVLDLRALDTIELNANKSIVSVGTGTTWDAVYSKLDPHGLSVNGGRAAGVGKS